MGRVKWIGNRAGAAVGVLALMAGVVTALPTAAAAAGGEKGELGIKGIGTVYAAPAALPVLVTTAGAAATFTVEVVNTGTVTSQYLMSASVYSSCDPSGCPAAALTVMAGNLNITPSITGPNGYFTAPIAAGKTAVYTVKLTLPQTGVPDNLYEATVQLSDTTGNFLSIDHGIAEIRATTGTTGYDQFFNGAGQATVRAPSTAFTSTDGVSSQTIGVGQAATYTVKLQNDAAVAGAIGYDLNELFNCSSHYSVSVKAGTTDVTTKALAGTYQTPVLAHGKSTTLTVKITMLSSPDSCLGSGQDQWGSTSSSGSSTGFGVLVVNTALGA